MAVLNTASKQASLSRRLLIISVHSCALAILGGSEANMPLLETLHSSRNLTMKILLLTVI
ncbi:MAG: hypothetical protein OFPII_04400 [Osedax symbiont Rs1]|nr:MAG: hypothetical protein OFPII_04400 [Osedax symbiont Rs1]